MKNLFSDARQDSLIFKLKLEDWFDETMQRANGWYKKQTQVALILIGFYVAFLFNVDTVAIYKILATDKEARRSLVQMAIDNKDKYQATIMAIDTTVADRIKNSKDTIVVQHVSDSLLKQTYQSISKDAEKANSILALGKPWKDSCEICKDSLLIKNSADQQEVSAQLKQSIDSQQQVINKLRNSINILQAGLSDKANAGNRSADTRLPDSLTRLKVQSDTILSRAEINLVNMQQKQKFAERCKFIKGEMDKIWLKYSPDQQGGWTTFFGWLLTALAISLGAPFWFDLLNKFVQMRTAGTRPGGDRSPANRNNIANDNATTTTTPDGETIRG